MGRRDSSLQVHQILRTVVTDSGKIVAQLGAVNDDGTAETNSENADWIQAVGFASRPSLAQPGSTSPAAYAVTVPGGDRDTCIGSQDVRCLDIYGNLGDGETAVFGAGKDGNSQGRALFKDDGSVTLLTTDDNTRTGKVVAFKVSPTGLTFTAPWGSFTFDASGFHMKTKAGPRIDMGGLDLSSIGIPAAISGALTGYCTITAPTITLKGSITKLGPGPNYGTCLQAPTALLAPGAPSTPIMSGPTSQCATVLVTTP